ncbi:MAG: UPF0262 family protein [Alphaproteobacteria bacterium]|nr:UPF0262 family protein [Alphaproteobacteria bacterium]
MEGSNHIIAFYLSPELKAASPLQQHDQEKAIADFMLHNQIDLSASVGPFEGYLSLQDNKWILNIREHLGGASVADVKIPVSSLRKMIKDYSIICENYQQAVATADPSKVQAIDMGRRSLHNEGAEMLVKILSSTLDIDFETGRRLFSILVVVSRR